MSGRLEGACGWNRSANVDFELSKMSCNSMIMT